MAGAKSGESQREGGRIHRKVSFNDNDDLAGKVGADGTGFPGMEL